MGTEIERRFLVNGDGWRAGAQAGHCRQGYLSTARDCTVRVRVAGDRGVLTIKGMTVGISRLEFEYPVPLDDANAMLDGLCQGPLIEKVRYRVAYG